METEAPVTVDFWGSPRRALVCFTVEPIGASQREGGEESTTHDIRL